jgi:putative ABC transport system permease protein
MVTGVSPWFWVRWSLRDLRAHWVAVVAIAVVIAIGTGVYAGLSSTSTWRRLSNDVSFAGQNMHDLRVSAAPGTFVDEGRLRDLVASLPSADDVVDVTERLMVDSQLEATTTDGAVLVTARIVGGTLGTDSVDRVWLRDGSTPAPGTGAAVLEAKFAEFHGLPTHGTVVLAGERAVPYTGTGVAPEDFYVTGPEGTVMAEADLATVYLHLSDAQALIGRPASVNDVVLTTAPGADLDRVERDLRASADFTGAGLTVTDADDVDAVRVLYEDIDNDQQVFTAFAVLVLIAAALAAFNLVNRIVEAQRREIGIGMALGAPRRQLSIRPLLVGAQIAIIGVAAGVAVGLIVAHAMQGLLESMLPLPEYRTPFQLGTFGRAAALGVAIPMLASAWPVWRAVHVEPIEAIRTGHLTARPGRFTDLSRRIHLSGSSLNAVPMRNLLRTPRRTVLTAAGVGVAIASLVSVLGMLDSFERAIDVSDAEITRGDHDRVLVQLTTPMPVDDPRVQAITADPTIGTADEGLRLPAVAIRDGEDALDLVIDSYDFDTAVWSPGTPSGEERFGGLVLARKAADDLDVRPGDTVRIRHPVLTDTGVQLVESDIEVSAIHGNAVRTFAYLDDDAAATLFRLAGVTNLLSVTPADPASANDVQRALFAREGVASTLPVARIGEAFDDALEAFTGFLLVTAVAVIALALLIAFNAARIAVEERQRDHATMRAFGLPVRSILGMITKENVVVGTLATLIGVAIGTVMLDWMLGSLMRRTLPEFGIERYVAPSTLAWAAGIGILTVSLAPLFLVRRIQNMDLPSTLRVME